MIEAGVLVGRLVVGMTFLVAGGFKVAGGRLALRRHVEDFGLPRQAATLVAALRPASEVVVGVLLGVGLFASQMALAAAVMCCAFIVGMIPLLLRRREVECGCFGQLGQSLVSWRLVVRNGVLTASSVAIIRWGPGSLAVDRFDGLQPSSFVPWLVAGWAVLIAVSLRSQTRRILPGGGHAS